MTWRSELRPASFRGVPFEMIELGGTEGRRFVADETPETDALAPTNDLGRRRPEFRVRAVVIGDDYLDRREALRSALNSFGPGELVHPWRGRLRVQVGDVSWQHDLAHGLCTFEFSCVDAGGEPLSVVTPIPASQVTDQVAVARSAVLAEAGSAAQAGIPLLPDFDGTVAVPELELFELFTGVGFVGGKISSLAEVEDFRALLAYILSPVAFAWPSPGSARTEQIVDAVTRTQAAIRYWCLIRVVELVVDESFISADQAEEVMVSVAGAFDEWLPAIGDPSLYTALVDLRSTMVDTLTGVAERLPRSRALTVPEPLPALVLAYDLYGDRRVATREAEIVALNGIGHPGFVSGTLRVLSR